MTQTNYRDLAEFGVPLVTPKDLEFRSLVLDIESRPDPFNHWPIDEINSAAVLLNQSEKTIVALEWVWRYTSAEGAVRTSHYSNLGSSMQLEVLNGHAEIARDLGTFILPGSKRLINEQGMFGNNLDVLPDAGGICGGYGAVGRGGRSDGSQSVMRELCLELAIFDDGLCAGPNGFGLFENLIECLARQRSTTQAAVTALRNGATEGQIFEIVRHLARRTSHLESVRMHSHPLSLLKTFANMAIHQLVNANSPELLDWFEKSAQSPHIRLHRPS
jgi:hypothetical protein